MLLEKKTLYSVVSSYYNGTPQTYWFDNLKRAREFSKRDYSDKLVVHNFKNMEFGVHFLGTIYTTKDGFDIYIYER